MRAGQRLLRDPGRPPGGRSRRDQLPGDLRRRPLQSGRDRDGRAHGRERGPGQRPQLAAAEVPGRRRGVVRRPAGRRPGAPLRAGHAPRDAHPAPGVAGCRGPAHQHGPAPTGEHEGRAPGRPRVHLHGRELVGNPRGPFGAGRPGGQRGGQALPRPEWPPSRGAGPGRGQRGYGRPAGGDYPVASADRPGGPHQAAARRPGRRGRPAGGRGARVRRPRPHDRPGGGAPGDGGEGRRPLHLPGPRGLREPR